ncbi:serine O-acetyltransferase [Paracoccus nototheniae]|uniref:serine O-acetyltransferase n=1 Tax=Paracoccus nototheniae TaxID=2489002 RepID=UPI0039ED3B4F
MILVAQWIGDDVTIRQNTTFGIARLDALQDRPVIGDRVEIGAGAVILGAVSIGDDAIVGANSVVRRDVAPGTIVGGVPAQVIGRTELPI